MKNIFLMIYGVIIPAVSFAQSGCYIDAKFLPFTNGHQSGSIYRASLQLLPDVYAEYINVWDQGSLTIVQNNITLASSSDVVAPLFVSAVLDGHAVRCQVE